MWAKLYKKLKNIINNINIKRLTGFLMKKGEVELWWILRKILEKWTEDRSKFWGILNVFLDNLHLKYLTILFPSNLI
jgi:hypothetical protein